MKKKILKEAEKLNSSIYQVILTTKSVLNVLNGFFTAGAIKMNFKFFNKEL